MSCKTLLLKIKKKLKDNFKLLLTVVVLAAAIFFGYSQYCLWEQLNVANNIVQDLKQKQKASLEQVQRIDNIYVVLQRGLEQLRDNHIQDVMRLEEQIGLKEQHVAVKPEQLPSTVPMQATILTPLQLFTILKTNEIIAYLEPVAAKDMLQKIGHQLQLGSGPGAETVKHIVSCNLQAIESLAFEDNPNLDAMLGQLAASLDTLASANTYNVSPVKEQGAWWQKVLGQVKISRRDRVAGKDAVEQARLSMANVLAAVEVKDRATYFSELKGLAAILEILRVDNPELVTARQLTADLIQAEKVVAKFCTDELLHGQKS